MQAKIIERYFFFGLLLSTLVLALLVLRPFWVIIVLSISFAVVLHPIYNWLRTKKLPPWLASLLVVLFLVILICGPLLGIGIMVFNQTQDVYNSVANEGSFLPAVDRLQTTISNILPAGIDFDINQKVTEMVLFVSNNVAKIFSSTLSAFFYFTLILLAVFYFLKDGMKWKSELIRISPLNARDNEKIMDKLALGIKGVVIGHLLIGLVQGVLMGTGLWFFGVPNPALWGVVAAVGSLVPMLGTALVSVPAIAFLLITGANTEAIGLIIWSFLLVGSVDNVLQPYLVGSKVSIPPLVILFAVLGGISVFGPIGVLVGPLIMGLLYTLISIYKNEFEGRPE